jgi:hypothetical protein
VKTEAGGALTASGEWNARPTPRAVLNKRLSRRRGGNDPTDRAGAELADNTRQRRESTARFGSSNKDDGSTVFARGSRAHPGCLRRPSDWGTHATTAPLYSAMNFFGGAALTVIAFQASQRGFVLLEGAWAALSLPSLIARQRHS